MIDRKELMKMAWKLAYKEYLRRIQVHLRKVIRNGNLADSKIAFTVKDCLSVGLADAWEIAKENVEREKAKEKKIAQENLAKEIEIVNKNAPRRELVPAGKYSVGQKLYGFIITGIGRSFRPHADMFSMGVTPDTEYVEYAYFN